jgi:hypothetical protein
MRYQPGATPHIEDKAGREAFKKAIIVEIKKLGGRPKESQGLTSLRQLMSDLKTKKPEPAKIVTPETKPALFKSRKK